jgi:ethanolamine utilization protein EutQ (cupin superfamily)
VPYKNRKEKIVPVILRKFDDVKWEKIGTFFNIDDPAFPDIKAVKEAEVSTLFDSSQCKQFGAVLEKWPPVIFDWHFEADEIFYIISGGPLKVTSEGKVMEGSAGDVFLFTRGTDLTFEVKNEMVGLTIHYPTFEEILNRYKEYAEKSEK